MDERSDRRLADIDRLVVVIGAMKAGTTSLFHYLSGHQQICPTSVKEVSYFSDDERYAQGVAWYRDQYEWDPAVHRVGLDASPRYSRRHAHPETAQRLLASGVEVQIVYLVRNPIARIESHYAHSRARGWNEGTRPLSEGIGRDLIETTRYAWQVEPFIEAFGMDAVRIVRSEELSANTAGVVTELLRFARLDANAAHLNLGERYNDGAERLIEGGLARRLRRVPGVVAMSKMLPGGMSKLVRRVGAEGRDSNRLTPAQRAAVLESLADDIARLRDLGVDTDAWGLSS